jgi:hypothetical protein
MARYRGPVIQAREHVPDHRGNVGDHWPAEFRFEGFGDGLRKPGAASDVKSVRLGRVTQRLIDGATARDDLQRQLSKYFAPGEFNPWR